MVATAESAHVMVSKLRADAPAFYPLRADAPEFVPTTQFEELIYQAYGSATIEEYYEEDEVEGDGLCDDDFNAYDYCDDDSGETDVRKYARDFLLEFRNLCTEKPKNLPHIEVVLRDKSEFPSPDRGTKLLYAKKSPKGRHSPVREVSLHCPRPQQAKSHSLLGAQTPQFSKKRGFCCPKTPEPAFAEVEPLVFGENRWTPGKVLTGQDAVLKNIKGILNKLTLEKFEKLLAKLLEVEVKSPAILQGMIQLIHDKAMGEPTFGNMYARLCSKLAEKLPEFVVEGKTENFRRLLLNKCQKEFEKIPDLRPLEDLPKPEREAKIFLMKKNMLGNIKFIGELYKMNMVNEKIIQQCNVRLLGDLENPDEEDIEALCQLLTTTGKLLEEQGQRKDHVKAHVEKVFTAVTHLVGSQRLCSRINFMLQDLIDLKNNDWVPRRDVAVPKTIDAIHAEAEQEERDRLQQERTPMLKRTAHPSCYTTPRRAPSPPRTTSKALTKSAPVSPKSKSSRRGASPPPSYKYATPSRPSSSNDGFITVTTGKHKKVLAKRSNGPGQPDRKAQSHYQTPSKAAATPSRKQQWAARPSTQGTVQSRPINRFSAFLPDEDEDSGEDNVPTATPAKPSTSSNADPTPTGANTSRQLDFIIDVPDSTAFSSTTSTTSPLSTTTSTEEQDHATPSSCRTLFGSETCPSDESIPRSESADTSYRDQNQRDRRIKSLLEEFLCSNELEDACRTAEELDLGADLPLLIHYAVSIALERRDRERRLIGRLLTALHARHVLSNADFEKGFESLMETLDDLTIDIPHAAEYVGEFLGLAIQKHCLSLVFLASVPVWIHDEHARTALVVSTMDVIRQEVDDDTIFVAICRSVEIPWSDLLHDEEQLALVVPK